MQCEDKDNRTPLFDACNAGSVSNMIELISYGADVNHVSGSGKTPIFEVRTADAIRLLLKYGANPNTIIDKPGDKNDGKAAMDFLMKLNPSCPEVLLDEFLDRDEENNILIIDLEIFNIAFEVFNNDDERQKKSKSYERSLFKTSKQNQFSDLLLHPFIQIFVNLKFQTVWKFFVFSVIFQLAFVAVLTAVGIYYVDMGYCIEFKDHQNMTCFKDGHSRIEACQSGFNDNFSIITSGFLKNVDPKSLKFCQIDKTNKITCPIKCEKSSLRPSMEEFSGLLEPICESMGYDLGECWNHYWLVITAELFVAMVFLREFYEFLTTGPRAYLRNQENLIQDSILVISICFLVTSNHNIDLAPHFSAWMVFLVWVDLIMLFVRFNKIGEYIAMSVDVMTIMLLCMFTYIPIFFAFTFGFYILLRSSPDYYSYTSTFFKVLAMSLGEIGNVSITFT